MVLPADRTTHPRWEYYVTLQTTDDGKIIVNGREASQSELKSVIAFLASMLGYQLYAAATLGTFQALDKLPPLC